MGKDTYTTGPDCESCTVQGTRERHKEHLLLFVACEPFKYLAMDILGTLSKTNSGNQHVMVLASQKTKLTRAVLVLTVTSTSSVTEFANQYDFLHGIRDVLTD